MKYVVTGGAGFIGFNFIKLLLEKNTYSSIVNIDKLTYASLNKNIYELHNFRNYDFVQADICDEDAMNQLTRGADVVVNFAAESHVDRSIADSNVFIYSNIVGVNSLLNACRRNNVNKFVQISTDEIYGSLSFASKPSLETDAYIPSSPYSASKAAAEMLCLAAAKTFGQNIIITRSSNNYGPYQYPEKIIPLFIRKLLVNEKVPLYGNGSNIRDWIFVKDNCEAINTVIEKGENGQVYNIGGGNQLSNIDLTRQLLTLLDKDESFIEYVTDRLGHDLRYDLDTHKIRQLGWSPKYDFAEGLKETVDWYKTQGLA